MANQEEADVDVDRPDNNSDSEFSSGYITDDDMFVSSKETTASRKSLSVVSSNNGTETFTATSDASPYKSTTRSPAVPNGISSRKAVPGRPRRRRNTGSSKRTTIKKGFFSTGWCKDLVTSYSPLIVAISLWYSLGVVSIGSSKILLTEAGLFGGLPPLFLTVQQLLIGSTLLRFLLKMRFMGSRGLQSWPTQIPTGTKQFSNYGAPQPRFLPNLPRDYYQPLVLTGVYFCFGFLATNYGFSGSSAAYVETIKAAEPITSAAVAVWWGIEFLGKPEVMSLGAIVTGVLLSTLGNHHGESSAAGSKTLQESIQCCMIVMASNLCFSFRGLHQKLLRATDEGNSHVLDDLNLQYRMQQMGVYILVLPVLFVDGPGIFQHLWEIHKSDQGFIMSGLLVRYIFLAVLNGCAFASYNLASTFILTRISVVQHAALNCIRRIFAIIVTSIAFDIPITLLGAIGIMVSFLGFMSFTHFKVQRQLQPRPTSSLLPSVSSVNN
jgi:drug/metabolite transporter (DMT)-like permease